MKIKEKVAFNIASEASYVFILSGQKFIKNAKNGQFWRDFENLKLTVKQSVTRQVTFNGTTLVKNAKIEKFKCDISLFRKLPIMGQLLNKKIPHLVTLVYLYT